MNSMESRLRGRKGDLLFVDDDGVPMLVQDMVYHYGEFMVAVRYFDDSIGYMEPPSGMGLLDKGLSTAGRSEVEYRAVELWALLEVK